MPTKEQIYDEGDKLKDSGLLPEAVAKYHEALALDPNFALAHSALSLAYGRLGQHPEAIQHALKVCELEPSDTFSFTALSVVCQRAGKITEAEDALARARMMQQR